MEAPISHREGDLFRGLSFTTISATGPNGGEFQWHFSNLAAVIKSHFVAIIHYSPDPNDCATVKKDQVIPSLWYVQQNELTTQCFPFC